MVIDLLIKLIPIIIILILLFILQMGYIKAPPDEAYIISGFRNKVIIGKSAIRIPFLERVDKISLSVMTVDVKTGEYVPTNDFINVMVDAVVKIQISSEPELLQLAAKNFLNQDREYIVNQVKDVLEGNLREIIGQLTLPSMVKDRKSFGDKVQENAVPDLRKMGLELVAFNIQSFEDDSDVIQELGAENKASITRDASIARAKSEEDIAIAQAQSLRNSKNEQISAEENIAERQNLLDIKKSNLKKEADIKKAEADVAYEIQQEISRKDREQKKADADLVKEQLSIEIEKAKLDAQERQKADAEQYRRKIEADAVFYEKQKQSEAIRINAETEAESLRLIGKAEADAHELKGMAEAKSIDKKADAMSKFGEASILEMYFNKLPEMVANIAKPMENIDSITMYGEGNSSKMIGDITNTLSTITNGLNEGLGVDMKSIMVGALGNKALNRNKDVELKLPDSVDMDKFMNLIANNPDLLPEKAIHVDADDSMDQVDEIDE